MYGAGSQGSVRHPSNWRHWQFEQLFDGDDALVGGMAAARQLRSVVLPAWVLPGTRMFMFVSHNAHGIGATTSPNAL